MISPSQTSGGKGTGEGAGRGSGGRHGKDDKGEEGGMGTGEGAAGGTVRRTKARARGG